MRTSLEQGEFGPFKLAATTYTLETAATEITEARCGGAHDHPSWRQTYCAYISEIENAVARNELQVRDPKTGMPWRDREWYASYNFILASDLEKWIEANGVHNRREADRQAASITLRDGTTLAVRKGPEGETPEMRKQRVRETADRLRSAGVKNWLQQTAQIEEVSVSRMKFLLKSRTDDHLVTGRKAAASLWFKPDVKRSA